MKTILEVGDFCFAEFELHQIKRMKDCEVIEISDGNFSTSSGTGITVFPLTLDGKRISDEFAWWENHLREFEKKNRGNLNWPDIHWHFVKTWIQAMSDMKNAQKYYHEIKTFVEEAKSILDRNSDVVVNDIKLFR